MKVNITKEEAERIGQEHSIDCQIERAKTVKDGTKGDGLIRSNHIAKALPYEWKIRKNWFAIAVIEHKSCRWLKEMGYSISRPVLIRWMCNLLFEICSKVGRFIKKWLCSIQR